ncbi:MAG: hypothetical protein AAGD25_26420 [Cyanobacteria bacterium P01_F01_bin.150]
MKNNLIGSAKIGNIRFIFPLAILILKRDLLILRVIILGDYYFSKDSISSIEEVSDSKIIIQHSISHYPDKIAFFSKSIPQKIKQIKKLGFASSNIEERFLEFTETRHSSLPLQWYVIPISMLCFFSFAILHIRLYSKYPIVSLLIPLVCMAFMLAASWSTLKLSKIQSFILKPGRKITEIDFWAFLIIIELIILIIIMSSIILYKAIN